MARFAHFSKHALKRIGQRTKLDYFFIADMLDYGGAIDVGTEIVFDRKHWLFYSGIDDDYFVAIQDSFTGLVVTILPLDYHENLAWKVNSELFPQAKQKASTYTPTNSSNLSKSPTRIILKARYMSNNGYPKSSILTKFESSDYKGDLTKVLNDKSLNSEVCYHCKRKGIEISTVFEISISLGKNGQSLWIDWSSTT